MPTYDYFCAACGHRFEVVHRVHDSGPDACPACGAASVRKAFAPPTIHFKGSGWAKKERSAARRSEAGTGSDGSGDSKGGESKAGESKAGESGGGESKAPSATDGGSGATPATTGAGSGD